jgi:predicted transglutaminase-like cysteine proteinase
MIKRILLLAILLVTLTSCTTLATVPVIIQFDNSCEWSELVPGEIKIEIENEDFTIIGSDATEEEIAELEGHSCVERTGTLSELKDIVKDIQGDLDSSRDEKIREAKLQRTVQDNLLDREDLEDFLESENPEGDWPGGIISPYQLYVTPDAEAVQDLADELTGIQEIYEASLDWVWISDAELHGEEEVWLYPEEFLSETADYSTNPTGRTASDCEDQANTLASVLIAEGYDESNVRVVIGLVNFEGDIGGHAWVQVYEDGRWFDVEPTAGATYTSETGLTETSGNIPYTYFKYHTFPSVEIWAYYNNEYFWNELTDAGNAPPSWKESSSSWLEEDLQQFSGRNRPSAAVIYPLRKKS